jgi:hypothetical protein
MLLSPIENIGKRSGTDGLSAAPTIVGETMMVGSEGPRDSSQCSLFACIAGRIVATARHRFDLCLVSADNTAR